MNTPTLINLPPPPSEPMTPEVPGTPNSGTTSLSAISTTAIKDGHTGVHGPGRRQHQHSGSTASISSTNTLDAERADRISRLAGLERVTATRQPSNLSSSSMGIAPNSSNSNSPMPASTQAFQQPMGYFDSTGNPRLVAARSTVGSASATGSLAGRTTTWTSGGSTTTEGEQDHDVASVSMSGTFDQEHDHEPDKMSDVDAVSSADLSDGGQESLVQFGEGANSTVSGPVSAPRDPVQAARLRAAARMGNAGQIVSGQAGSGMTGIERTGISTPQQPFNAPSGDSAVMEGVESVERAAKDRIGERDGGMRSPEDRGLGRFPFEER